MRTVKGINQIRHSQGGKCFSGSDQELIDVISRTKAKRLGLAKFRQQRSRNCGVFASDDIDVDDLFDAALNKPYCFLRLFVDCQSS